MTLRYVPEIDGLRAIAVLGVLLFHLEVPGFPGGYVGVDIFFVVSGFLISRIILDAIEEQRFSFSDFYLRRARRILPALIATLVATFIASAAVSPPAQHHDTAASTLSALFSVSNFYFWTQAGYFSKEAHLMPLLHTWSLSVEEQFYLMWPALLVVAFKLLGGPARVGLFIISFVVLLAATQWVIPVDPDAGFFLTPFRATELMLGAACVRLRHWSPTDPVREALTLTGLVLMIVPLFVFSRTTPFPGVYALIPCLGAALIIIVDASPLAGALLRSPVARFFGLISYSLYLVHWPIYSFWRVVASHDLTSLDIIAIALVSIVVATLSWRFIETPFRNASFSVYRKPASLQAPLYAGLLAMLVVPTAHSIYDSGWPWRFDQQTVQPELLLKRMHADRLAELRESGCHIFPKDTKAENVNVDQCVTPVNGTNVMVIGSSYGADMAIAARKAWPDANVSQLTADGCRVFSPDLMRRLAEGEQRAGLLDRCRNFYRLLTEQTDAICRFDVLIMHEMYGTSKDFSERAFRVHTLSTARAFQDCGVTVVIAGPRKKISRSSLEAVTHAVSSDDAEKYLRTIETDDRNVSQQFETLSSDAGIGYLDLQKLIESEPYFSQDAFFFTERNHWSAYGADVVARRLRDKYRDPLTLHAR